MPGKFLLFVFIALSAVGCGHKPLDDGLAMQDSAYRLSVNDVVTVHVFGESDLSADYAVDGQGAITLPLTGKVAIGGGTEQEAAQKIAGALKKGGYLTQPRVTVALKDARPIFVMGEVEKAGEYKFRHGLTVYQAVAQAGGYTYRADRGDIVIRRPSEKTGAAHARFAASEDTPVLPGDSIEIGERFF